MFTEKELDRMNEAANDAAFVGGRYGSNPKQFVVTDAGIYAYGNDCGCEGACNHFEPAERERISKICLTNSSVSNSSLETILNGGI